MVSAVTLRRACNLLMMAEVTLFVWFYYMIFLLVLEFSMLSGFINCIVFGMGDHFHSGNQYKYFK